jgi:hypothetical protein
MERLKDVTKFHETLAIDSPVTVRWTNCGYYMEGAGRITKLNEKSVRVVLTESVVAGHGNYPAGQELRLPRKVTSREWSWNNGVFPPRTNEKLQEKE